MEYEAVVAGVEVGFSAQNDAIQRVQHSMENVFILYGRNHHGYHRVAGIFVRRQDDRHFQDGAQSMVLVGVIMATILGGSLGASLQTQQRLGDVGNAGEAEPCTRPLRLSRRRDYSISWQGQRLPLRDPISPFVDIGLACRL
jgi:hypothetical protein